MKRRSVTTLWLSILVLSMGALPTVSASSTLFIASYSSSPQVQTLSSSSTSKSLISPVGFCGIFSDAFAHDYYCYALKFMNSVGAVGGYPDGTFRPGNGVTRGQFSKMVMKGFLWATNVSGGPHFEDVPPGSDSYDYVETVYNRGIIGGYTGSGEWNVCIAQYEDPSKNYFRPCLNVTRGQMAKFTSNAAGYNDPTLFRPPTFHDVPSYDPFFHWIERLTMHISTVPFPPPAPICYSSSKPCFFPTIDVLRADAVASIFEAYSYSGTVAGRAFASKGFEDTSYDGVHAYITTPSRALGADQWIAGPIAVADVYNRHWVESGPWKVCNSSADCEIHPYGSSYDGNFNNATVGGWNTAYKLTPGVSYGYRSYYATSNYEWWGEFLAGSTWVRTVTSSDDENDIGVSTLNSVAAAVETNDQSVSSGQLQVTDFQLHTPGGSWSNSCYDPTTIQRKMYSSIIGPCISSGWTVEYIWPYSASDQEEKR